MKEELKVWCQETHVEVLAQLAVFKPAQEPLQRDGSVVPALEMVAKAGLSEAARELAAAALSALSDRRLVMTTQGQKHVMLSCESRIVSVCAPYYCIDNVMPSESESIRRARGREGSSLC